jgi:hypothetical protein
MELTRRAMAVAALVCLVALGAARVEAVPLGLIERTPDITSSGLDVSLTSQGGGLLFRVMTPTPLAGQDLFGFTDALGTLYFVTDANYVLAATLDSTGQLVSGTVDIEGAVLDLGIASGTLFHGTLMSFGFSPDPNPGAQIGTFEFLVNVTSSAAGLGFGSLAGTKINATDLPYDWNMTAPFTGSAIADTFAAVPQPAAMLLVGLGAALIYIARRR